MTNKRRRLVGRVTSNKMDKTVVVSIEMRKMHPIYKKVVMAQRKRKPATLVRGGPGLSGPGAYLLTLYLVSSSRASASICLAGMPLPSMSATQLSYRGAEALTQLSNSLAGMV